MNTLTSPAHRSCAQAHSHAHADTACPSPARAHAVSALPPTGCGSESARATGRLLRRPVGRDRGPGVHGGRRRAHWVRCWLSLCVPCWLAACAPLLTSSPGSPPRSSPLQWVLDSVGPNATTNATANANASTALNTSVSATRPNSVATAAASAPSAAASADSLAAAASSTVPSATAAPQPVASTGAPAPKAAAASEPRFDLIVNNAPAKEVFLALGADGRFNVLTHPDVSGNVSVTLRRVTLREALEALRDVYGYDFKVDGRRVTVYPPTLQSRVFVVNYLHSQRNGRSDVRVSSGSAPANGNSNGNSNGSSAAGSSTSAGGMSQPDSSQVSTQSHSDLWTELGEAVRTLVGNANGRSVVVSPQSGLLAVRAMPDELRQVEAMLTASRLAVERQVMLDVKIVSVELREGFQSGIDWSLLRGRGNAGLVGGASSNPLISNANGIPVLPTSTATVTDGLPLPTPSNGLFGLSLALPHFQAVMGFLETHGEVQTLSSPRLATLNNQKAVLKVGTDDYFITNVSGGTVNNSSGSSNTQTTLPTLTLTPFFSGIALDVTPQIDDAHMITLHVHPSVSAVTERKQQVDLGTLGAYKLPLASSSINETDTIVRIPDGQIVAIGGLMQMESSRQTSGVPGSADHALTATLLGNRANSARKKELVVLIRPTIIRSEEDWQAQTQAAWAALESSAEPVRTIRLDGPNTHPTAPAAAPPTAPGSARRGARGEQPVLEGLQGTAAAP